MKDRIRKLMARAGLGNQRRLVEACERIAPPRVGVKHDLTTVGTNLVNQLFNGKAKQLSFEQIDLLCRALKCTPNHFFGWEDVPGVGEVMTAQQVDEIREEQVKIRELLERISRTGGPLAEEIKKAFH